MKLLTDQCLRGLTVRLLRDSGHDVTWLRELGQQKATDAEVLQLAHQLDAVAERW